MSLRKFSILGILIVAFGGAVVLIKPHQLLSQATLIAQNDQNQSGARNKQNSLIQKLNLSSEQFQRIQAIRRQYKDRIAQNTLQLRQAQQELRQLIAGSGSPEEIRAKHRQIESYQQQLADLKFESMLATRQVLTPEQRRIFVEQMQRQNKSNKVNKLNIKTTQL